MMAPHTLLLASSYLFTLLLLHFFQTCLANCTPSACGVIRNISSPFRLKGDPKHCGYPDLELVCENDVASVYLNSHKYYVKEINYTDYTSIRVVDASINNDDTCSFPTYSAYHYTFIHYNGYLYLDYLDWPINLMSCPHPLKNSSMFTDITTNCNSSHPSRFSYIKLGHMNASEVPETCRVEVIVMTSWIFKDLNNVTLSEIHHSLLYGFQLYVCPGCGISQDKFINFLFDLLSILVCIVGLLCAAVSLSVMTIIIGFAAVSLLSYAVFNQLYYMKYDPGAYATRTDFDLVIDPGAYTPWDVIDLVIGFIVLAPRLIIFPLGLWILIYKFRKRHLSMYNIIESFLQSDNKLAPIRYSYSDIRKMTRSFRDKLGEGGYGSVYKGKLRSGHDVAVKLLRKSSSNGEDFINEISTIGRIHHVNVVKLVGYCAQGSKRALVFDFMPNGSLEKYLFNREKNNSLNLDTKFEIALAVARGIEYLHRGCNVQILHFDIKPHNILLDDKFIPKISDFGLAKFCSTDKNAVTMTAARGTIGYVAPELISRSIGAVSYKADVYSFGMLLMDMVSLKKDLIGNNGDSNFYFPDWIYDYFSQGRDIEIGKHFENDENDTMRKLARKMTIVALWCIQMGPDDRPSMNRVLKLLECDVERLQIPAYPSQSTRTVGNVDENGSEITYSTDSAPLLSHDDVPFGVEISVQE